MTNKNLPGAEKHPFLWVGSVSLGVAIASAWLNIYLGSQVNYLDYLFHFNALTIVTLACVVIAIALSVVGLWSARFRSAFL